VLVCRECDMVLYVADTSHDLLPEGHWRPSPKSPGNKKGKKDVLR
jgi:hypothetical protein